MIPPGIMVQMWCVAVIMQVNDDPCLVQIKPIFVVL